jgi:glycosyltransferase involved in cell wall biosynthesis
MVKQNLIQMRRNTQAVIGRESREGLPPPVFSSQRQIAYLHALLGLTQPEAPPEKTGLPPSTTKQQWLANVGTVLAQAVIAADALVLKDICSHEATRGTLIEALKMAPEGNAALWCIASAIDMLSKKGDAGRVFQCALNVDIMGDHTWIRDRDIARERVLTNRLIASTIEHPTGHDLSLFRSLKRLETHSIASSGTSPGLSSSLEFISDRKTTWPDWPITAPPAHFLPLIHPWQRTLQSLAFHAPDFCRTLLTECRIEQLRDSFAALTNLVPVYMVVTRIGYPMGGGESFMHSTCRILSELGYRCLWVSFHSKEDSYSADSIAHTPYYDDLRFSGGVSVDKLDEIIDRYRPDVIHCQGGINPLVQCVAARHRVPTLVGYHFWDGLVRLAGGNREILKNSTRHKPAGSALKEKPAFITEYVASEFMLQVYRKAGGRRPLEVYHPVSDPAHYLLDRPQRGNKVVQINIAAGKGGGTFLACARALGHQIPFYAVRTEPNSTKIDEEIRKELSKHPSCDYMEYGSVQKHLSQARLVLVPTLVDETFCRVAFEAAANGIPVLSTANGFLPQLLGDSGIYLPDDRPDEWIAKIHELYGDAELLRGLGERQKSEVVSRFGMHPREFIAASIRMTASSPRRNVGIFAPWSEQGLGEQARTYASTFRKMGLRAHVLSYQAYGSRDKGVTCQHWPEDWMPGADADTVHYSLNDRERVTFHELEQFIHIRSIGRLVYPEICYSRNWVKITSLKIPGLRIAAVPNCETVRASEVLAHNELNETWYNTRQCMQTLSANGVRNGVFIGHGVGPRLSEAFVRAKTAATLSRPQLTFCHFGGHNPVSRKQTGVVVDAFRKAASDRPELLLKVFIMDAAASQLCFEDHDQIEYHLGSLHHADVMRTYEAADVSIQISSHEGLGLGFYESISRATPVISIDIPPHNEVIQNGKSGWLLTPSPIPLQDNAESLVKGGIVDPEKLANLLGRLDRHSIAAMQESTSALFNEYFTGTHLSLRLAAAMQR